METVPSWCQKGQRFPSQGWLNTPARCWLRPQRAKYALRRLQGFLLENCVLVFGFSPVLYVHLQLIMLMLLMFWKEKGCCRLWAGSVFADTSNSLFCRRLQRLHSTNRFSNQTLAASSIVLISQPIRWLGDFHRRQRQKKTTTNKQQNRCNCTPVSSVISAWISTVVLPFFAQRCLLSAANECERWARLAFENIYEQKVFFFYPLGLSALWTRLESQEAPRPARCFPARLSLQVWEQRAS